jgi:peptidoglycan hydrolase CwlO-like protein
MKTKIIFFSIVFATSLTATAFGNKPKSSQLTTPNAEHETNVMAKGSINGQHNLNLLTSSCEDIYKTLSEADGELKKSLDEVCTKIEKLKQADLDVLKGLGLELNKTE